jgi:hypothetical protein
MIYAHTYILVNDNIIFMLAAGDGEDSETPDLICRPRNVGAALSRAHCSFLRLRSHVCLEAEHRYGACKLRSAGGNEKLHASTLDHHPHSVRSTRTLTRTTSVSTQIESRLWRQTEVSGQRLLKRRDTVVYDAARTCTTVPHVSTHHCSSSQARRQMAHRVPALVLAHGEAIVAGQAKQGLGTPGQLDHPHCESAKQGQQVAGLA